MKDLPFSSDEFDTLRRTILPDLRSIARQTQGECTVDDLINDAWLLAFELQSDETQDHILSQSFQKTLLSRLYNRFCKFFSKRLRRTAISLDDTGDDDEEGGKSNWRESLTASEEADPFVQLCQKEEMQEQEDRFKASYSEAAAYFLSQENLKSRKINIADHLALSWAWVRQKFKRARDWVQRQNSLFDGIEVIDENFIPLPNKLIYHKPLSHEDRRVLEHQRRLMQRKLFPGAYVPIRIIEWPKAG